MKVTIHQPAFMPWLGLMSKIQQSDIYVCLDHAQYSKNSFDNRNRIIVGTEARWLTVPVETSGKFKNNPLNKVEIADMDFRDRHTTLLANIYNNTDEKRFLQELLAYYSHDSTNLFDWQLSSMQLIGDYLGIKVPIYFSSQMDIKSTGSMALLEICQKLNATEYISGPMGKEYLDRLLFNKAGIKVSYHIWDTTYPLSAIHYMLRLGIPETKELLASNYELQA